MPSESGRSAARPLGFLLEFEKPLAVMEREIEKFEADQSETGRDFSETIKSIRSELTSLLTKTYENLTPWETVQVARHPRRPLLRDYIRMITKDFVELNGDRVSGNDGAIICGFARMAGQKVMLIGHQKGRDTREKIAANFGCAHPEGYRKALLKMKLAQKYGLPVVCLIDTQGAYPGIGAEERGIAFAIATNLMEMSRLRTPIVCAVIGEGGSGGALGIGVGDRVAMFQHSFYSVISPEGCAAILWKTADQRKHAAEALRLTAAELLKLDIVDEIIPEPVGGAHRNPEAAAAALEKYLTTAIDDLKRLRLDSLVRRRQERIRNLGAFFDDPKPPDAKSKRKEGRTRKLTSRASRLNTRLRMAMKVAG
ncbi:MAG: acetyl-CoA carboxylase carboxyltransferase subunit alpha [Planctomycetes bacterium]|nr:acetyl-CoA carboxylase carboxyltransferase subunit alpha [Planctomycetota bacterium]